MLPTALVKISIVIVNYNTARLTAACLESILKDNWDVDAEIFVVDNGSSDGSVEMLEEQYPQVRLIANGENLGFARANNLALREAKGKYVLILNPDTVLPPGTLQKVIRFMDIHPKIGVLGPKLVKADGSMDLACRRSFPTVLDVYLRLLGVDRLFPKSKLFGHYNLLYLDPSKSYEVDSVAGAFMLVRRQAIDEVGLFDERFFMYAEDLDWCYRFKLAGWKVFYLADVEVLHYKGKSTRQEYSRMIREFYKAGFQLYQKYHAENSSLLLDWLMRIAMCTKMTATLVAHDANLAIRRLKEIL